MENCEINIRDPFVLVYQDKYYMYGTRAKDFGTNTAGFDVYVGNDLESWSGPKEVFNSAAFGMNGGVNWAPEVHYYKGSFYMFATFTKENGLRGTYILKSDSPEGPFVPHSEGAVTPYEWECLDGTLYVENDKPYLVFCHEHTQIFDGTICYVPLTEDLKRPEGECKLLFAASSFLKREASEECHNVTDGPYLYRLQNGGLIMIWSTSCDGYMQCVAKSSDGSIIGEWYHIEPIFTDDGGHGMIFRDLKGDLRLTLHCPNESLKEKPVFFRIKETDETIIICNEVE